MGTNRTPHQTFWCVTLYEGGNGKLQSEDDSLASLVRLAKVGDEGALTKLILRYHRHVYQTAYAIVRSRLDAEEITQDTFIRMYRKVSTLEDEHAFHAWLTTTTTRLAIDHARRNKKHYNLPLDETKDLLMANHTDLSSHAMLTEALDQLTPQHRAILLLRERDGYEYMEIAAILKIPIGTVKSRLANAKKALRLRVERDGDTNE